MGSKRSVNTSGAVFWYSGEGGRECRSLNIGIVYDFISKLPEWAKASFNIHVEVK